MPDYEGETKASEVISYLVIVVLHGFRQRHSRTRIAHLYLISTFNKLNKSRPIFYACLNKLAIIIKCHCYDAAAMSRCPIRVKVSLLNELDRVDLMSMFVCLLSIFLVQLCRLFLIKKKIKES